jgi:hypothetical protein
VLTENEGEQRELNRVALPLNDSEVVVSYIRVLWREGHKPHIGKTSSEMMIKMRINFRISYVLRSPFQAMFADYNRSALFGLHVLRYKQNAVGEYAWPKVENNLVSAKFGLIICNPRTRGISRLAPFVALR